MSGDPNTVYYTSFESNSFLLTYSDHQILVDPWLTSTLDFLTPKFSSSTKPLVKDHTNASDLLKSQPTLLLISQSLPDHLHEPTLKQLSKSIPVIAAPSAVSTLQSLGFQSVTGLPPGDTYTLSTSLKIRATTGSVVGPPWQKPENGWLFTFGQDENVKQIYMEPHGNHPKDILEGKLGKIDGVITPVVHAFLPALRYTLVQGFPKALDLLKKVKPEVAVVLMNHVSQMKGWLTLALKSEGNPEDFQRLVKEEGLNTKVVIPKSLENTEVFRVENRGSVASVVKEESDKQKANLGDRLTV